METPISISITINLSDPVGRAMFESISTALTSPLSNAAQRIEMTAPSSEVQQADVWRAEEDKPCVTQEALRLRMRAFMTAHGKDAAVGLLQEFGTTNFTKLEPSQYDAFITRLADLEGVAT